MAVHPSAKHNFALPEHLMGKKKIKTILNKLDQQILFYITKTELYYPFNIHELPQI